MKNNTSPLVSVAIISYNHEKYIEESITSIINQTYENLELIIIDDGSTDSTFQKIQQMEAVCKSRFVRFIAQKQSNQGTCIALKNAYKMCKGKYIYDIASDDVAKTTAIQKQVFFLEKNSDYGLCVADNEIIDDNSYRIGWDENRKVIQYDQSVYKTFGSFLRKERFDVDFISEQFGKYKTLITGNYIPNGYLIRNSIFLKIGYFTSDAPLEDWWMMLQISKYSRMKYIDEVLFSYRWHDSNNIKNSDKMRIMGEKTRQYEDYILDNISIANRDVLPEVIEVKYERDISNLQGQINSLNRSIYLINNKKIFWRKYFKYLILSKITFGRKRKKYKEKRKFYKSELNL